MSEQGCWPEQEAVWKWMKEYGIELTFEQEMALKKAVSAPRIEADRRISELEAQVRTAGAEALVRVAAKLRQAGADLPVRVEGTIESAHKGGLSCALVVIEEEARRLRGEGE